MNTDNRKDNDILEEFKKLGNNLREILKSALEKEETQKLKGDIAEGVRDLGQTLNDAAEEFSSTDIGSKLRREAEDFRDRVRSGEVEQKARAELHKAMQIVNRELKKAAESISPEKPSEADTSEEEIEE